MKNWLFGLDITQFEGIQEEIKNDNKDKYY